MIDQNEPTADGQPDDTQSFERNPYPDRPHAPEIGDNPAVDALRPLPERLGFVETPELTTERLAVADWLIAHAADVEYALDQKDDTPELAALQLHWGAYVDVTEKIVDLHSSPGRPRATLGMLIDHALIYYDSGLTHQFWERVHDIKQAAEGEGLLGELPELTDLTLLD